MSDPKRHYSVEAPCSRNISGKSRVTVRTGGPYQVYVCVASDRVPMSYEQGWALWIALGDALRDKFGDPPSWAAEQMKGSRMPAERPPAERAEVEALIAAYDRWKTMPRVELSIFRKDAYALACGMQLLLRHPGIGEPLREVFEAVGRHLQEQVSDTPEVYALLEAGWNPARDVRQPDAGG